MLNANGPGDADFIHSFVPAAADGGDAVLLLLHGTGGNEKDLLPLGQSLLPGAALLSPRGKVAENGMPRFFRRLAEGVLDEVDLVRRTHEMADFVTLAAKAYGFNPQAVIAVGYSNGANLAAAMLLLRPEILAAAILLHPMVPLVPPQLPDLSRHRVLITAGRHDPLVQPAQTERLQELLRQAGADVSVHWQLNGHAFSADEVVAAHTWLQSRL